MVVLGILSLNPSILIKDIEVGTQEQTAKYLLLILTLSVPIFVIQRTVNIIYDIRLKGFINKRIVIITNIIHICSVVHKSIG